MTNCLAIDTTTEACSVALLWNENLIFDYSVIPQQHTKMILPVINKLLSNAGIALKQLDVLAVTNGPGSFTGIRLGLGVIQGLAYGANLPVCTVSTLAVLSQGIYRIFNAKNVLPVIDARMKQIYYGLYKLNDKLMTPVVDDNVSDPDKITLPYCQDLVVAGTGLKYCDIMKKSIGYDVIVKENEIYPSAQDLIPFVEHYFKCKKYISPEDVIPNYLRDKVVI